MAKKVGIVGATGSIGTQALDVISKYRDSFQLVFLTAHTNVRKLKELARRFSVERIALSGTDELEGKDGFDIYFGRKGLEEIVEDTKPDVVLVASSGNIGVFPVLKAIELGIDVALANKETLVSFGNVVMKKLSGSTSRLIPVDSEHSAIFQLLEGRRHELERIILTASGGPFRNWSLEQMEKATVEDALKHPTWKMGRKITVDSATLMNKVLELVEAYWLFGTRSIDIVIHPQSIVHSFIRLKDGSLLAHMGFPDMRVPIAYALSYPERLEGVDQVSHPYRFGSLEFYEPDRKRFPALDLGYFVLKKMQWYPTCMNAANEEAVSMFLEGRIGFLDIVRIVEQTISIMEKRSPSYSTLEELLRVDEESRRIARQLSLEKSK